MSRDSSDCFAAICVRERRLSSALQHPLIVMRCPQRCIRIYSTYSPCSGCISKYSSFLEAMPELEELHLIVSSVYMSDNREVNSALETFEKKFRHKVKLEAFKDEYWESLKEHLSEEGAKVLENKAKNYEASRPHFSSWEQSPATTPRKARH